MNLVTKKEFNKTCKYNRQYVGLIKRLQMNLSQAAEGEMGNLRQWDNDIHHAILCLT